MFRNKFLILCFIFYVHAYDRDYDVELAADADNVRQFPTTTRSKVHHVAVTNGVPKLVIACYAQGQTQRSLLSIWRTVTWSVNSSDDVTLYSGYSAVDVYSQWRESGHIVNWILPWKTNTLSVSPFNHSCIAVRASEYDCEYDISLTVTPVNLWLVGWLLVGLFLYFSARRFSTNVVFYYGTGVTFGLLASLLIVVFILSRFIPKKSAAFALLGVGFSVTAWLLQHLWQNIQDLLLYYSLYVATYFITAGVVSFAVCYYKGPVTNPRLLDLIRWSIQVFALGLVYYSSAQIVEVAATIIILVVTISVIPRRLYMLGIPPFIERYWRRRFPPKVRLLTAEEYVAQGIEETQKALEELRQYCRSPDCNAWKTISRLSSPVQIRLLHVTAGVARSRFVEFVEGNSQHITNDEMYLHDESPSPQLPFDSDDD